MPKTKFIVAEKHLLKKGQGKYGPWQLVKVVAKDGEEYTTFNADMYVVGNEYEMSYEERVNGNFTSKNLIDRPETKTDKKVKEAVNRGKAEENANHKEVMNALRMIYALIEKGENPAVKGF